MPERANIEIIERIWIKFFKIGLTSIEAISDSFSFKTNGFCHTWPSYQPDSSYSTFSDVNLLNTWFQPRLYLGWNHVFKRLTSEKVEYEESGWYDGQVWIKPLVLKEKESLIASIEVKPILKNLIQISSIISVFALSGVLLFQNINF